MDQAALGSKLIEIRNARGLTQEEVAERSNVNVRTIQRLESGMVKPRVYTIKALSGALDFNFLAILENSESADYQSELKRHTFTWYVKDLFNLKTNTMKKVTILIASSFIIIFSSVVITSTFSNSANNIDDNNFPGGLEVVYNEDNSLKEVKLSVTHELTFDSLVNIKEKLEILGITINYTRLAFDDNNKLVAIYADVNCHDGFGGSFGTSILDSKEYEPGFGFSRNYSNNSKSPFRTGWLGEKPN